MSSGPRCAIYPKWGEIQHGKCGGGPCPPLPLDQQFHIRAQRFTECAHGVVDLLAVEHPLHVLRPENPAAASGDGPIKNLTHVLRNDDPTGCERERTSRCH
jgi:hypothetical protein